jgi:hypothetical protein
VNAQPEEFRLEIPDADIADLRAPAMDALLSQSTARRRVRSFYHPSEILAAWTVDVVGGLRL